MTGCIRCGTRTPRRLCVDCDLAEQFTYNPECPPIEDDVEADAE